MVRVINAKPDKFLIHCVEMDIYDLLYKSSVNNWIPRKLSDEVSDLLRKYVSAGLIKRFSNLHVGSNTDISVKIHIPKTVEIKCSI